MPKSYFKIQNTSQNSPNNLVTVICISFNHKDFIEQAIRSVWAQTYSQIQLIVADDGSCDGTKTKILELKAQRDFVFISNEHNVGYCKTFNLAFKCSTGLFIVDLAGDDVLLPDRIERQVEILGSSNYGVAYSNCLFIDDTGKTLGTFHKLRNNDLIPEPQSGLVFPQVLGLNFISTPTMMIRREVLTFTQGYDESLVFEDFDFWIRSAKRYTYLYDNRITTQKRVLKDSLSKQFYKPERELFFACLARILYRESSLNYRKFAKGTILYYLRTAIFTENFASVKRFLILCRIYKLRGFWIGMARVVFKHKLRLYWLFRLYQKIKNRL